MNKILPSEETFEIADPVKLEKYENKSSENGHPYKKSHLAISILLLV